MLGSRQPKPQRRQGFTIVELLTVVSVVFLFALLSTPLLSGSKEHAQKLIDLNNVRQIMAAANIYANNNSDYMPHSSWGSIDGGAGAGPDSWAYATQNRGRIPGAPAWIPSAAGRTDGSQQLPFYSFGLLAPYLSSQKILECPKDLQERTAGIQASWYRARSCKLTSYTLTGATAGYGGVQAENANLGGTYKINAFNGNDLLLWEADESTPFNFNDAGANPANTSELPSFRHGESSQTPGQKADAIVGRVGGAAEFIPHARFGELRRSSRNELLCGPGFR